ncbi:MAG: hypothetical protein RIS35_2426 [Pseudomonadota bacterium]|jgi:hypothetical protein
MTELNETTRIDDAAAPSPSTTPAVPELSRLMVLLLKGVLYRDDDERLWASLLRLQARVREQASVLLLDLVLDEAEGHAFLRGRTDADETDVGARLPRLVARRPLPYAVSLMLALLRKRLAEFDAGGGDTRLVLTRDEIAELMRVFLPDGTNETRLVDRVDQTITKVVELGFLRKLEAPRGAPRTPRGGGNFEVRRILKAFVDAQWLADFDARLDAYRNAQAEDVDAEPAGRKRSRTREDHEAEEAPADDRGSDV